MDQNRNGGGIIVYAAECITSKLLTKHKFPDYIEALFIEINCRKCNWLLRVLYHPPSQSDQYFFVNLDKALDVYIALVSYFLVAFSMQTNALRKMFPFSEFFWSAFSGI